MRRHIRTTFVFLVLGACVTVAVAWACALWIDYPTPRGFGRHPGQRFHGFGALDLERADRRYVYYAANRSEQTGAQSVVVWFKGAQWRGADDNTMEFEDIVPPWARGFLDIPEMERRTLQQLDEACTHRTIIDSRGWPCLAMWGGIKIPVTHLIVYNQNSERIEFKERRHWIVNLNDAPSTVSDIEHRWLPLRPAWPGFAINTFLYGTALWLPFASFCIVRRWNRTRRGLCHACAYPVGTSDICTECGKRVTEPNMSRSRES